MSEIKHEENKEQINIGTIGHVDHGRITLIAAITNHCSLNEGEIFIAYDKINVDLKEKSKDITIYKTHVECPGHLDFIKNMITNLTQIDEAILVSCGPIPETTSIILENNFVSKYQQYMDNLLEDVCKLLPIKDVLDVKFKENVTTSKIKKEYLENINTYYKNVQKNNSIYKNRKQHGYIYRRS